ncbi:MAG: hypothetical protein FWE03_03910 [Firmicutes bacterium]|nr:hypothetical protein [Bacillota bacterium]
MNTKNKISLAYYNFTRRPKTTNKIIFGFVLMFILTFSFSLININVNLNTQHLINSKISSNHFNILSSSKFNESDINFLSNLSGVNDLLKQEEYLSAGDWTIYLDDNNIELDFILSATVTQGNIFSQNHIVEFNNRFRGEMIYGRSTIENIDEVIISKNSLTLIGRTVENSLNKRISLMRGEEIVLYNHLIVGVISENSLNLSYYGDLLHYDGDNFFKFYSGSIIQISRMSKSYQLKVFFDTFTNAGLANTEIMMHFNDTKYSALYVGEINYYTYRFLQTLQEITNTVMYTVGLLLIITVIIIVISIIVFDIKKKQPFLKQMIVCGLKKRSLLFIFFVELLLCLLIALPIAFAASLLIINIINAGLSVFIPMAFYIYALLLLANK